MRKQKTKSKTKKPVNARQAKIRKVLKEAKAGKLKTSGGKKVTNPKQAIAIALSEAKKGKKA